MKIWLVWLTNVGKSTLFNRIIWQFKAIVTDIPWTTVDILKFKKNIDWLWVVEFLDSPGLWDFWVEYWYIEKIVNESDLILFVVDWSIWFNSNDDKILELIRKSNKINKTILIVNKLDKISKVENYLVEIWDYYKYWIANVFGISAKNSINIDYVQNKIKKMAIDFDFSIEEKVSDENVVNIAILWKPNSWKSTLLNTLTKKKLAKVEDKSWTTRDYIQGFFEYLWKKYVIYDTAWIKKRWKMRDIEVISYKKTMTMLEYVRPFVIFMVDINEWLSHRDMTLLKEISTLMLPIVLLLNKIDTLDEKHKKLKFSEIKYQMEFAKYIPIVPISAMYWFWKKNILKMVEILTKEYNKKIETNKLNLVISNEFISRSPRFPKNKICKIKYITQVEVAPPTFIVFVNNRRYANFSFKRRIENVIRKNFWWFIWCPIRIVIKDEKEKK